jgi:Flp pilus assembly protein TadG
LAGQILYSVDGLFSRRKRDRRTSGQSLVEIAILFPLLLMLISGLVEFGFLLNQYLNLLDGAREAARFASDGDPFIRDPSNQQRFL